MDLIKLKSELKNEFCQKEWFDDVGHDNYGNLIIYVKYHCNETIMSIPDYIDGVHILVHFAASKPVDKCKFVTQLKTNSVIVNEQLFFEEFESQIDLLKLTNELDSLKKICGAEVLETIFYESHDGKNAITNLSETYPLVRENIDHLYEKYGFDIIYEQFN